MPVTERAPQIVLSEESPTRPLHKNYKWELLGLLFCAYFFYYADRTIFGVVKTDVGKGLHLTDTKLGWVDSIGFFTLALCMPFAGLLVDRFSRKWVITLSLILWSACTACTGLAGGLFSLILIRSLATTVSESLYGPASTAILAAFHRETRSFALSVHQAAIYIGAMSSGLLGGKIAEKWGWHATFYCYGLIGVVLGALFIFRLKDAPREPSMPGPASQQANPFAGLAVLFRVPTARLLLLGFTAIVFVNNAYLSWSPRLLQNKFNLTLSHAGHYAMFRHHITALIAILIGGAISDRLAPRFPKARLIMMTVAMLTGTGTILVLGLAPTLAGTCLMMAAYGLCRGAYECNTHASMFEFIEPRHRGAVVAMMLMVAMSIGSLSPLMLGWCSDHWGPARGLSIGFSACSVIYLIGGLSVAAAMLWTAKRDRIREIAD